MDECKICADLAAKLDISESLSRYCRFYDSGQFERLREIFHPAAKIDFGVRFCGNIDQFIAFARSRTDQGNRYSHHVANIEIETGAESHERSSLSAVSALVESGPPDRRFRLVRGHYEDSWTRSNDSWVIVERKYAAEFSVQL